MRFARGTATLQVAVFLAVGALVGPGASAAAGWQAEPNYGGAMVAARVIPPVLLAPTCGVNTVLGVASGVAVTWSFEPASGQTNPANVLFYTDEGGILASLTKVLLPGQVATTPSKMMYARATIGLLGLGNSCTVSPVPFD